MASNKPERTRFLPPSYHEAFHFMFNNQFKECEEILAPTLSWDPISLQMKAEMLTLKSLMTQSRHQKDDVIKLSQEVETMVQKTLKRENLKKYISAFKSNDITQEDLINWKGYLQSILADTYLLRAINQILMTHYVYACWNIQKSWKTYDALFKESVTYHPDIEDKITFGVGVFMYIFGFVGQNPIFKKVLEILGFRVDSETGLQYLTKVWKGGGERAPGAALALMLNYIFFPSAFGKFEDAIPVLEPLIKYSKECFPDGTFFLYITSLYERKLGKLDEACELLLQCLDSCDKIGIRSNLYLWELANTFLMKLDFEKAAKLLETIVFEEGSDFEFLALCAIQLAAAYAQINELEKAKRLLKNIKPYTTRNGKFDKLALRVASAILDDPYPDLRLKGTSFELLYFRRDLAHMPKEQLARVNEQMKEIVETAYQKQASPVTLTLCHVIRGAVLYPLGEVEEAIAEFNKALEFEKYIKKDKHWIVAALYELSFIQNMRQNYREAEVLLKRCASFSGYDWQDSFKTRINKALKQVKLMNK